MTSRNLIAPLCFLLAAGCAADADDLGGEIGSTQAASTSTNGRSLNGVSLNGRSLNGRSLNGKSLNGISLNGRSLNGRSLNGVSLNGASLTGFDGENPIEGEAFVGATFTGYLSDGTTLELRIDGVRTAGDLTFHQVSFNADGGWQPLCGGAEAIALAGRWNYGEGVPGGGSKIDDPTQMTFACRGNALAKCVELGYKPWVSGALADHHQACTRMIRADYCGDGTPGTIDGWSINMYDAIGVQADTESAGNWVFEARWTPDGALCVDEYRMLELVVSGDVPACALVKVDCACSEGGFTSGALIQNEYDSSNVVAYVQSMMVSDPHPSAANKVAQAVRDLEHAFAFLGATPPDRDRALDGFRSASSQLEVAIQDGLSASYGIGLLNRIAGVARHQATSAIHENQCDANHPNKLEAAMNALADGDAERAAGRYKHASGKWKIAVVRAEDAQGSPCP